MPPGMVDTRTTADFDSISNQPYQEIFPFQALALAVVEVVGVVMVVVVVVMAVVVGSAEH